MQWPIIEPFCMYTVNHCSGRIPCSPHTFLPTFGMWEHWWCIWWPDRKVALSEVLLLNSQAGSREQENGGEEVRRAMSYQGDRKRERWPRVNKNHSSSGSLPQYGKSDWVKLNIVEQYSSEKSNMNIYLLCKKKFTIMYVYVLRPWASYLMSNGLKKRKVILPISHACYRD